MLSISQFERLMRVQVLGGCALCLVCRERRWFFVVVLREPGAGGRRGRGRSGRGGRPTCSPVATTPARTINQTADDCIRESCRQLARESGPACPLPLAPTQAQSTTQYPPAAPPRHSTPHTSPFAAQSKTAVRTPGRRTRPFNKSASLS